MKDKKFKPKTQPTGFGPPKGKIVKKPADTDEKKWETFTSSLAYRVKVAYTQERSRWESLKSGETVEYRPPKRWEGLQPQLIDDEVVVEAGKGSTWQQVVDWCQKRDINPIQYVRIVFTDLPMKEKAPEPNQLWGPQYERKWKKLYPKMEERLKLALEVQRNTARDEYLTRVNLYEDTPDEAALYVATSIDLSPLFRYCFAVSIGSKKMLRVARKYLAEAVLQFECYRDLYKKAWAGSLPKGFSKLSKELYPSVLAEMGEDLRGYVDE